MKTSNNATGQPKRTLLTGFDSFDCVEQDYTPKYLDAYLYCHSIDKEHLSKGFLPRCQLLEQIFNDPDVSFNDIFYPPTFTKPPQPKNHREYKLTTIGGLISVLNWWVKEKVEPEHPVFWFYAYSYSPCKRRVIHAVGGKTIDDLITEFNFSHPAIAAELKELASNLVKKAIEWDESAHLAQQWQQWIDPSRLNPVEVKGAAAALLYKLRHISSMVREETADLQQQADLAIGGKTEDGTQATPAPAIEKAYQSYQDAVAKNSDLADKKDKEAYAWLENNGIDDYTLPAFETWQRYVRAGRKFHHTSKNTPRAGRASKSVVNVNDPAVKQITNKFEKAD